MSFTTGMTTTAQVDDSIKLAFGQSFIIAAGQLSNIDAVVTVKEQLFAKSIQFPKYTRLTVDDSALTEDTDPDSTAVADAAVLITPREFGQTVQRTKLASIQTGGMLDSALPVLVGLAAGEKNDRVALTVMKAGTNTITANNVTYTSLAATDVMSRTMLNAAYNKLSRNSVQKINGSYWAILHDDVIHDLRADATASSWTDVNKYSDPTTALSNEVGMMGGFRILRNNFCQIVADEGAGSVDNYYSYFLGFNGLGKAVSEPTGMSITGPFDKLGRYVNVGYYGVYDFSIVDTAACVKGISASSVGANS